jgi:hypothetical protein
MKGPGMKDVVDFPITLKLLSECCDHIFLMEDQFSQETLRMEKRRF